MSVVGRGRVIQRGAFTATALTPPPGSGSALRPDGESPPTRRLPGSRRVTAEEVRGHVEGQRLVREAEQKARAIIASAQAEAAAVASRAADEARDAEHAKLSALYLAMAAEREKRALADLDRTISLAVLLAERLLGASLELHSEQVALLARQALAEARGARRAILEAHPLDAAALERHVESVAASGVVLEVRPCAELTRGSMRVHTNLGTLDAQLTPQLERLAKALRDALGS